MKKFFIPYIGEKFAEGINGKKVLVLGASFYCDKVECPFFSKCTNRNLKDSSPYDAICPEYKNSGIYLHDEPSHCVENADLQTYKNFASYISGLIGCVDYYDAWSRLAFTNYVQYFLDANNGFRETHNSDLCQRDFDAFIEVVKELQPDIVVVWGCVINAALKDSNPFVYDKESLKSSNGYVCHMRVPGENRSIAIINPYHPSSSAWHSDIQEFNKYFIKLLNQ